MFEPLPSPIELAAIDHGKNIRRRYSISVHPDLFGWVNVHTSWGRIGTRGLSAVHSFRNSADAIAFVQKVLRKRSSARSRIGTPYLLQSPLPEQKHLRNWLDGFTLG